MTLLLYDGTTRVHVEEYDGPVVPDIVIHKGKHWRRAGGSVRAGRQFYELASVLAINETEISEVGG